MKTKTKTKTKQHTHTIAKTRISSSRLTRSLYSENIQHGPPLVEYANEVLNMRQQNALVILECTTTPIPSFITLSHKELLIFDFVVSQSEQVCKLST